MQLRGPSPCVDAREPRGKKQVRLARQITGIERRRRVLRAWLASSGEPSFELEIGGRRGAPRASAASQGDAVLLSCNKPEPEQRLIPAVRAPRRLVNVAQVSHDCNAPQIPCRRCARTSSIVSPLWWPHLTLQLRAAQRARAFGRAAGRAESAEGQPWRLGPRRRCDDNPCRAVRVDDSVAGKQRLRDPQRPSDPPAPRGLQPRGHRPSHVLHADGR